ncbi:MAG: FtsW/RodA/SpoVE family cell cycle protein [Phycisphaeraceae bacterium]|jgi:cell division protein FtsW (lipid II flippase)|nr:FtsW/RodA/SpoVE family cell cycle protein [Phycisphaeraceae bacterium]
MARVPANFPAQTGLSLSPLGRLRLLNWAWLSVLAGLALSLLGVYAIDLGTGALAGEGTGELAPRAIKQVIFLCAGLVAGMVVALPDYRVVRLFAWTIFFLSLGLLVVLVLPFVPASLVRPVNGVRAWIDLGPIDLQPTELVKVTFIMVAADYFRFRKNHREVRGFVMPAVLTFIPIALILLQPDLGSALLFIPTIFAIVLAAGAKLKHLAIIVACGLLALPVSYPLMKPYQKQRIVGLYYQLTGDKRVSDDINYQSLTAISLIGAGQWTGYPDAKARAVIRYAQLPERHNDMIFSVVAARFGLAGVAGVFALYGLWIMGALLTAATCKDPFGRLVCVGFAALLATQALVNIGMVVGVLPIIGVTLPFVSAGGSSMISVWIMTGLLVSIGVRPAPIVSRPTFEFGDQD